MCRGTFQYVIHDPDAFITTWKTRQITIFTDPQLTYNYSFDWDNDGTLDETGINGNVQHSFATGGNHTIRITGTFPAIQLGYEGLFEGEEKPGRDRNARKLRSVDQWGKGQWLSMKYAFANCKNLQIKAADAPDLSQVTDLSYMFRDAPSANPEVSNWDLTKARDIRQMLPTRT